MGSRELVYDVQKIPRWRQGLAFSGILRATLFQLAIFSSKLKSSSAVPVDNNDYPRWPMVITMIARLRTPGTARFGPVRGP